MLASDNLVCTVLLRNSIAAEYLQLLHNHKGTQERKMSFLGKFSFSKLLHHLVLAGSVNQTQEMTAGDVLDENVGEEISLERIKDLIVEANSALDDNKRELLLRRAERIEVQLIETYRAKGLKITADNICDTLQDYRRRYCNH